MSITNSDYNFLNSSSGYNFLNSRVSETYQNMELTKSINKKLDQLNDKVNELFIAHKKTQGKAIFSENTPLPILIDEGIFKCDISKMENLLKTQSFNPNKRYLTIDDEGNREELTALLYIMDQLSNQYFRNELSNIEELTFEVAIERIELLLKYGAKLDQELVTDYVLCMHDEDLKSRMMQYIISKKELICEPISSDSFKSFLVFGRPTVKNLNYLIELGAPLSEAKEIFNANSLLRGLEDDEAFELLNALHQNGYCMKEQIKDICGYFNSQQNLLSWFLKWDTGINKTPKRIEIIEFVLQFFVDDFKDKLNELGGITFDAFIEMEETQKVNGIHYSKGVLAFIRPLLKKYGI